MHPVGSRVPRDRNANARAAVGKPSVPQLHWLTYPHDLAVGRDPFIMPCRAERLPDSSSSSKFVGVTPYDKPSNTVSPLNNGPKDVE